MNRIKSTINSLVSSAIGLTAVILGFAPSFTAALSGSQFQAGNIISDAVFYNPSALDTTEVQHFLNSKVPTCDTNGSQSKSYYYNSSTGRINNSADTWVTTDRATYGSRYDKWYKTTIAAAPYTCLKDYKQDTPAIAAESGICGNLPAYTGRSAALIISDISAACGISPKVLIVLLQKEQGLVTDDWPWANEYQKATGFGCPDTSGCNSAYYGFFNQVYHAARQYRLYRANPINYNYVSGRTNYIPYNPNSACGTASVYITNQATAGLYNYTPYVPNKAALNNLYGSGDSCSAYGNRNFWRYFCDWFGSTQTNIEYAYSLKGVGIYTDATYTRSYTGSIVHLAPGQKAYVQVKAYNNGNKPWDPSFVRLGTSGPHDRSSQFYDSSWYNTIRPTAVSESSVLPGDIGTFDFAITAPSKVGNYNEQFNLVAEGITWMPDQGINLHIDVNNAMQAQNTKYQLTTGQSLLPGQYLLSQDTKSVLALQTDGNGVLYKDFVAVWSTKTAKRQVSRLTMQSDGNLVLYDTTGKALWSSGTAGNSNAHLTLQTDGNLVIYSAGGSPLWSTATNGRPDGLSYVNSRVITTAHILGGQELTSVDGSFHWVMQSDGNLVLYNKNGLALWSSRTAGHSGAFLNLQGDGNLVVYSPTGSALWSSRTDHNAISNLVMQADGNLVLYNTQGRSIWNTNTMQKILAATSTNSLSSGQQLGAGQSITSTNGSYRLILQGDGNLVLYSSNGALWSSRTAGKPVNKVVMQSDGNFVTYSSDGHPYWNTATNRHPGALIMLQDNGELVVYDVYSRPLWSSAN